MKLSYFEPSSLLFANLALASHAEATNRTCHEYLIPVNVSSQILVPTYGRFNNSFDVTAFVNSIAQRTSRAHFNPFSGPGNVSASYNIGATFCSPTATTEKEKPVLVASHGLGYDRRYWDSEVNPANYSFVDFAIARGYSVFLYDRLGTGLSSKVSGYDKPQTTTQVAILQQITELLREGKYTGGSGKPSKIVHVGHSFGSTLTNAMIAADSTTSDGVLLTGIAHTNISAAPYLETWSLRIATQQAPGKWEGRDNNYLTLVDAAASAAVFLHDYSDDVLYYSEYVKQPLASIELLTLATIQLKAPEFTKPVMVINGEFDYVVCGGDCTGLEPPAKEDFFPNATDFQAIVHPAAGHGFNFDHNATGAYDVMLDYLGKHNL